MTNNEEMLFMAKEWKLFEGDNPVISVKLTKEPKQRLRFLEPEEVERLLAVCSEPCAPKS